MFWDAVGSLMIQAMGRGYGRGDEDWLQRWMWCSFDAVFYSVLSCMHLFVAVDVVFISSRR
jgi:hypothetical protein